MNPLMTVRSVFLKILLPGLPLLWLGLLSSCSDERSALERVLQTGELRIITREGPTSWYMNDQKVTSGPEFELVSRFAESLGVKPVFIVMKSLGEMQSALDDRQAELVAAGITKTPEREKNLRFSRTYQDIFSQVVYKIGSLRPRTAADLVGKKVAVISGSSHEEILRDLQKEHPGLEWESIEQAAIEEQIKRVREAEIDYLIGDSHELAISRRYYPRIRVAFDISMEQKLAWAFPSGSDNSLLAKANHFLEKLENSGELHYLLERYYGHVERLNFVDRRTFFQHADERLPTLTDHFKKAAENTGYDWRLLAAMGYQESHWNPNAKSPTGVRGIMMLTRATAKQMGVKNRLSPEQSILGGAKYLKRVEKKIPERITGADRLWLALASYNIGFAHLEDGRILTQRRGDDPDKWADVKKHLPDLADPEIAKTLKYGLARGQEPVDYVDNIRNFHDLLVWREQKALPESEDSSLLEEVGKFFK